MKQILAATVMFLSVLPPADAQCGFRRRVIKEEVIVKEVIATPVAVATVPVIVPAFSYQYAPPPPVVAPGYGAAPMAAPCAGGGLTDAQIDALLLRLQQRMQQLQQVPPAQPSNNQPAAPPAVIPQAPARAVGILQARCAQCHSGQAAKGQIALFDANGAMTTDKGIRARAFLAASSAKMPPAANGDLKSPHAVPDAEIALLTQWASE